MLRRIGIGLACALAGYLAGAFGGGYAVYLLSTNTHDRDVEAAMTGAFAIGPLIAVIAFIAGAASARPRVPRGS